MDKALTLCGLAAINTRPAAQCVELSAELARRGARVLEIAALEISLEPPSSFISSLQPLSAEDLMILTSRNSCLALERAFAADPEFAGRIQAIPAACVGTGTASLARLIGCNVETVAEEANWEGLFAKLLEVYGTARPRIFALRGSAGGRDLPEALRGRGFPVEEIQVYGSNPRMFSDLDLTALNAFFNEAHDAHVLTVFSSPAGVRAFMHQIRAALSPDLFARYERGYFAALGRKTAQTIAAFGLAVSASSENSNLPALVGAIEEFYNRPLIS